MGEGGGGERNIDEGMWVGVGGGGGGVRGGKGTGSCRGGVRVIMGGGGSWGMVKGKK